LDAKSAITLPAGSNACIVVANCNGPAKSFVLKGKVKFVAAPRNCSYALVTLKNGGTKMVNLNPGKGYLSSDAPGVWLKEQSSSVSFFNSKGQKLL